MIVLDEHMGQALFVEIDKWYIGRVKVITDLRPDTVVKDDNISQLFSKTARKSTFVTINTKDFWRKIKINNNVSLVCFKVENNEMKQIPKLLKLLFSQKNFKTKAQRAGHMFRIDQPGNTQYYHHQKTDISKLQL